MLRYQCNARGAFVIPEWGWTSEESTVGEMPLLVWEGKPHEGYDFAVGVPPALLWRMLLVDPRCEYDTYGSDHVTALLSYANDDRRCDCPLLRYEAVDPPALLTLLGSTWRHAREHRLTHEQIARFLSLTVPGGVLIEEVFA